MEWVAKLYERGEPGVPQDYRKAAKWWKRLAEMELPGVGESNLTTMDGFMDHFTTGRIAYDQYSLARLYGNGDGVIQDYLMAHMFSNIAYANTPYLTDAKGYRDKIEKMLTQEQLIEAQSMARECMESH